MSREKALEIQADFLNLSCSNVCVEGRLNDCDNNEINMYARVEVIGAVEIMEINTDF